MLPTIDEDGDPISEAEQRRRQELYNRLMAQLADGRELLARIGRIRSLSGTAKRDACDVLLRDLGPHLREQHEAIGAYWGEC